MKRLLFGLAVLALGAATAGAYSRITVTSSNPVAIGWDFGGSEGEMIGNRLTFRLNPAGSADVGDGSDLTALEAAFQSWEDVSDTALAFSRGADFAGEIVGNDDVLPVFWVESSTIIDQDTPDPSDDVDIGSALAITFTFWWTGGPAAGEIIDANVIFNGFDHRWTTDPAAEPGRFDIESVALHEFGHAFGFGHSVVGGATMFPRTGAGNPRPRTPSRDDIAAAGASYGDGNWSASTARLTGVVRDGGSPVFGAHVVVQDSAGNVVAGAMTLTDGSYEIDGLPPGSLEVWAEPLDPNNGTTILFNEQSLPGFWRGGVIDLDFRTSATLPVVATAGATSVLDLNVPAGPPGRNITMVGPSGGFLSNSPAWVDQGDKDVQISVAGPVAEMPAAGTPLSVSGGGFTPKSTSFQTFNGGTMQAVSLTVDVDPDAVPGLRSLIIDDGSERTIASGHLEVVQVGGPPADSDGDTIPDGSDNCPAVANAGQQDLDADGAGDVCDPCPNDPLDDADSDGRCADVDNCPSVSNAGQQDADADGAGDACDSCPTDPLDDVDSDGRCADADNCPSVSNPGQQDSDSDGAGDDCDPCPADALDDADSDGLCADVDNCPAAANPGQQDSDSDGAGDDCDPCPADDLDDADSDGLCADVDNCPAVANGGQQDTDSDDLGDACDSCPNDALNDSDADGHCTSVDNCPTVSNQSQDDGDLDGAGDACDICPLDPADDFDADGACGDVDNCPTEPNPGQANQDGDAYGDVCDFCPADARDRCVTINLLRQADASERSADAVQAVFVLGQDGGLDPAADMVLADIASTPSLSISGDAAVAGEGNAGVLIFYDVQNTSAVLIARRAGDNVVLSGW